MFAGKYNFRKGAVLTEKNDKSLFFPLQGEKQVGWGRIWNGRIAQAERVTQTQLHVSCFKPPVAAFHF